MRTRRELSQELSTIKGRLEKAVFFEITEDISIGISESDGLFRIRRSNHDGVAFLNSNYQWEEQPMHVDLAYSGRTGYYTADEAFEIFEVTQILTIPLFIPPNMLKNN